MPLGDVWGNSWLDTWGDSWAQAQEPPEVLEPALSLGVTPHPIGERILALDAANNPPPARGDPVLLRPKPGQRSLGVSRHPVSDYLLALEEAGFPPGPP